MKEIYALGIGYTSPVFIEFAQDAGYTIKALYHFNGERTGEEIHGFKIIGSFDDLLSSNIRNKEFLLTMGDMQIRKQLSEKIISLGGIVPSIIHPSAIVSRYATVSQNGVLIAPYCIVQADAVLGDGVVMRDSALVCHTTKVDSYTFIGPKAIVGAKMHLGEGVFVGQQALLVSGKVKDVGINAIVGAGAVATKSVDDYSIVVGNPAKSIGAHQDNK